MPRSKVCTLSISFLIDIKYIIKYRITTRYGSVLENNTGKHDDTEDANLDEIFQENI